MIYLPHQVKLYPPKVTKATTPMNPAADSDAALRTYDVPEYRKHSLSERDILGIPLFILFFYLEILSVNHVLL